MTIRFGDGLYGAQNLVGEGYFSMVDKNYTTFINLSLGDFVVVFLKNIIHFLGIIVDIEDRSGTIGFVVKNKYNLNRYWFSCEEYQFQLNT